MKKYKQPTWTTLTLELLKGRDDLMTVRQVAKEIGATLDQARASLIHLRKYRAVEVVVEPDGTAWWLATPENDNRCKHLDERTPEDRPRCRRCYTRKPKKEKTP
jgi:hypothetical protein